MEDAAQQPDTAIRSILINGWTDPNGLAALRATEPEALMAAAALIATEVAEQSPHPDGVLNRLGMLDVATRNTALMVRLGVPDVNHVDAHRSKIIYG